MQTLKIDMLKFTGARHFKSKDGTDHIAIPVAANDIYVGDKGSYVEITLRDNKDGKDQYENDGFAAINLCKARREAGEKGPIIGNWRHVVIPTKAHSSQQQTVSAAEDFDDIPF